MTVKTWSNLIGWNGEDLLVKYKNPVEESVCFQMVHFKRCEEGAMELSGGGRKILSPPMVNCPHADSFYKFCLEKWLKIG